MATTTSQQGPMAVSCITPNSKWVRAFVSGSTYATALPALSAKADVLSTGGKGNPGATDPLTGKCFIITPPGSLIEVAGLGAADNGTFTTRIWRWYCMDNGVFPANPTKWQLTARPCALLASTVGAKVGIANGIVTATEGYVDTMVVTTDYGPPPLGVRICAGPAADNSTVSALIDPLGADFIELEGTLSGGTATVFDFLIRGVSGV